MVTLLPSWLTAPIGDCQPQAPKEERKASDFFQFAGRIVTYFGSIQVKCSHSGEQAPFVPTPPAQPVCLYSRLLTFKDQNASHSPKDAWKMASEIDEAAQSVIASLKQECLTDQLGDSLMSIKRMAFELKSSRHYRIIWGHLTKNTKKAFDRIAPFSLSPDEHSENDQDLVQSSINSIPKAYSFQGRFSDGQTFKLRFKAYDNSTLLFRIDSIKEEVLIRKVATLKPVVTGLDVHLTPPMLELFSFQSEVDSRLPLEEQLLIKGQLETQALKLRDLYYQKLIGTLGFPINMPLYVAKSGEYFIETSSDHSLFFEDLKLNPERQKEHARTIGTYLGLELRYGIQAIDHEGSITVSNGKVFPKMLCKAVAFEPRQEIRSRVESFVNKLLQEGKEHVPFTDELKLCYNAEMQKLDPVALWQQFQEKIPPNCDDLSSFIPKALVSMQTAQLFIAFAIPAAQENITVEALKEKIVCLSGKILSDMPNPAQPIADLREISEQDKITKIAKHLSMQFQSQAELTHLLVRFFIAYAAAQQSSLENVLENYFTSDEGLFQELSQILNEKSSQNPAFAPLKSHEVTLNNETIEVHDGVTTAGEYFGIIFWENFIRDFQLKAKNILENTLDTKVLLYRALYEEGNIKNRSVIQDSLNKMLHNELMEQEQLAEKENLYKRLILS